MEDFITLDYGSGGGKTSRLINDLILPLLNEGQEKGIGAEFPDGGQEKVVTSPLSDGGQKNSVCDSSRDGGQEKNVSAALLDGAVIDIVKSQRAGKKLVFTTDSFVIDPLFFPGGDIGKLSVCGTVNDLAMMGAKPEYLSLSFIIEEGFSIKKLEEIVRSISDTAREAGVRIVTGDTKVVDRGRGDGIYINTAGIGFSKYDLKPENIWPGDSVIVSGTVGDHGTAVMLARNPDLGIAAAPDGESVQSDCAPLHREALSLAAGLGSGLRVMRDPTRGGLATTLNEFVEGRKDAGMELTEKDIPISGTVHSICDILGLDPLYCACEGRLVAVVSPDAADRALELLQKEPHGKGAKVIGHVTEENPGRLVVRTPIGTGRIAAKLSGAQLPRIC